MFSEPRDQPTIILVGGYEIFDIICGTGAFGAVFKAFDRKLKRSVALKVFWNRERAREELQGVQNVAGVLAGAPPSLPRILDWFEVPAERVARLHARWNDAVGERSILVTEWVHGRPLADRVPELDSPRFLERVAIQVIVALAFLHKQELRHGDIRPTNILIEGRDRVWLIDYSLVGYGMNSAFQIAPDRVADHYRAPEELGLLNAEITIAADLYALGLVLLEQILGKQTLPGPAQRAHAIDLDISELVKRGFSEHFCDLLQMLLNPEPQARLAALELASEPSPAVIKPPQPNQATARRSLTLALSCVPLVLLLSASLLLSRGLVFQSTQTGGQVYSRSQNTEPKHHIVDSESRFRQLHTKLDSD